jgi:hypothetical protein
MIHAQNTKLISVTPPAAIVDNTSYATAEVDTNGFDYAQYIVYLGATDIAMTALSVTESDVGRVRSCCGYGSGLRNFQQHRRLDFGTSECRRTTTRSKCSTSTSEAGSGISTSPQRRATERLELLQRSSVSCPVRARHRSLLRTVAATKFSQSDLSISFLLSFGWSIDFGRSATRSEDSTEDRWLSIHTL